jgi:hypothetical protein
LEQGTARVINQKTLRERAKALKEGAPATEPSVAVSDLAEARKRMKAGIEKMG